MTEKVKELRKIIPVPMGEALKLLKENNGDIDLCVKIFKEKSILEICELTGCTPQMAEEYYTAEKYDFNRTVSMIREALYDQHYSPIEGLTPDNIRKAIQWVNFVEDKDLGEALYYKYLDEVLTVFSLIPSLNRLVEPIKEAGEAKKEIFEGYSDEMPIDEFVRRHKRLDDEPSFQQAEKDIMLGKTVIKEELLRHLRNLVE